MQPVYNDFIKHSYLVTNDAWTNVSPLFGTISADIMNTFLVGTVGNAIGNKLKNFRYFTSKIKLTFIVQGFPLAYGKLVFYADPRPRDMENGAIMPAGSMNKLPQKCRSMLVPHVEIDPSKTEIHELILECPTVWGCYSLDYTLGSYSVGYQIINPLLSGQAGAPPSITYSVYMSLVDPEMSVLSYTSSTFTDREQSKISNHVSSFSKGMAMMSNIPVLGPFATLASSIGGVTADALSWFGFSKPVVQHKTNVGVFYSMDEQGVMDGKVHSHTLALRNDNSVTINPNDIPLASFEDQEIEKLANRIGFVRSFGITTAMTSGTIIGYLPLRPECIYVTDSPVVVNGYEPHPFCLVTRGFQNYRCDNKVRIEFISSVFHRATIVAAYFPDYNDIAVAMSTAVQTVKSWQFQICGNSVYDLEIPYSQPEPFLSTHHTPSLSNAGAPGYSNGVLVFYVLNPNISNGTGAIYMNLYMGGCNLSMGVAAEHVSYYSYSMTSGAAPANTVNPLCIKDPHFYQNFFGEECAHTTKELAGRSTMYLSVRQDVATVRTDFAYEFAVPAVPPAATNTGILPTAYSSYNSMFKLLLGSYVGYKGSTHLSVYPDAYQAGSKTVVAARAAYQAASNYGLGGLIYYGNYALQATMASLYSDTQNFMNVKVPYYYKGFFRPTFPVPITTQGNHNVLLQFASTDKLQTSPNIVILAHAGDDFNFVMYRGTPVLVMT